MSNKYCNLVGSNKIKDEYDKINDGFDSVDVDVQELDSRINNLVNVGINSSIGVFQITATGTNDLEIESELEFDLVAGLKFKLTVSNTNTSAVSITYENTTYALQIINNSGVKTPLSGRELIIGNTYDVDFDGADFILSRADLRYSAVNDEMYTTENARLGTIENDLSVVQTAIANIGDASPAGVYATLSALEAAYPSGDTNIYIVSADGHWYYWNGVSWTDGGTYQAAEISDNSIVYAKNDDELKQGFNVGASLASDFIYDDPTYDEDVLTIISDDSGDGPTTGFYAAQFGNIMTVEDTAHFEFATRAINLDLHINYPSGTLLEFFINNADIQKCLSQGLFLGFNFLASTANKSFNVEIYSVINTSLTKIYESNYIPVSEDVPAAFSTYLDPTEIPAGAEAIRIYIKGAGYTAGVDGGVVQIANFNPIKGIFGCRYLNADIYKLRTHENRITEIESDVVQIESDVVQIESDIVQLENKGQSLLVSDCDASEATFSIDSSQVVELYKPSGWATSHYPLFFKEGIVSICFKHIRADDWIIIGGDAYDAFTAIAIGSPWSVRLADLGSAIRIVDISITPAIDLNTYVHIYWEYDFIKIDISADLITWTNFAEIDMLTEATSIVNWKTRKIMGATTPETVSTPMMQYVTYGLPINDQVSIDVNKIKPLVYMLEGLSWNVVGDSITEQGRYITPIESALGLTATNCGLSSSTMAINNSYLTNLSVVERVAGLNGNPGYADADIWTIFAGVNDWLYTTPIGTLNDSDLSTFHGAIKAIIEDLVARPNAPIIVFMTPLQSNRNGANGSGVFMSEYRAAIIENCEYYSIPYIDLYTIGGLNPLTLAQFAPDGVHPNELGTARFYPRIVDKLRECWIG